MAEAGGDEHAAPAPRPESSAIQPPPAKARESWVDVAKGIAIVLVVLFHAVTFMGDVGLASVWYPVIGVLDTFRMPLFFLTAGLFAAKALRLPFRELFWHRIANLLWLYLLWSVIWAITFFVVPSVRERPLPPWLELVLLPVWPNVSTWFVYALALFFAAAWLIRSWPLWAQFLPAVALTLLFGTSILDTGNDAIDKMATYFVFFLIAARFGPAVRDLAPRIRPWHAVVLFLAYGALAVFITRAELTGIPGARLVASVLAVSAGVSIAVVLSRSRLFEWLRFLGTRTLPIYLIHFYPILILAILLDPVSSGLQGFAPVIPPIVTMLAILFALGIHRLTRGVPGLYALPASLAPKSPGIRR